MTRDQAVEFVLSAVTGTKQREVLIPKGLPAFRVMDLATAMHKSYTYVGLPEHEKLHESMDANQSSDKARLMSVNEIKEALHNV